MFEHRLFRNKRIANTHESEVFVPDSVRKSCQWQMLMQARDVFDSGLLLTVQAQTSEDGKTWNDHFTAEYKFGEHLGPTAKHRNPPGATVGAERLRGKRWRFRVTASRPIDKVGLMVRGA